MGAFLPNTRIIQYPIRYDFHNTGLNLTTHIHGIRRVGDRLGGNILDASVRAFVYRWAPVVTQEGETIPYTMTEIPLYHANPQLRCGSYRHHGWAEPSLAKALGAD